MHDNHPIFEFRFNQTAEDVQDFYHFHYSNSPTVRRSLLMQKLFITGLLGLYAIWKASSWDEQHRLTVYLVVAALALLVFLFYGRLFYRVQMRAARRLLAEGKSTGLLGPVTLRFWPDRFVMEDSVSTTECRYAAVERVVETETCFYLYLSALSAVLVKKSLFSEMEQLTCPWVSATTQ